MTRYYYYIESGTNWDGTTKVYKIGIGSSAQGRRDYLAITANSVDGSHYFEPVSNTSDAFVHRVLQSLAEFGTQIQHVSARDFVRSLRAHEALALSSAAIHNADSQRMALDLGYRIQSKLNARRAG